MWLLIWRNCSYGMAKLLVVLNAVNLLFSTFFRAALPIVIGTAVHKEQRFITSISKCDSPPKYPQTPGLATKISKKLPLVAMGTFCLFAANLCRHTRGTIFKTDVADEGRNEHFILLHI